MRSVRAALLDLLFFFLFFSLAQSSTGSKYSRDGVSTEQDPVSHMEGEAFKGDDVVLPLVQDGHDHNHQHKLQQTG